MEKESQTISVDDEGEPTLDEYSNKKHEKRDVVHIQKKNDFWSKSLGVCATYKKVSFF